MAHVSFQCRFFALKYAADAACTVLRVDQVGFSATKLSLSRSLSLPPSEPVLMVVSVDFMAGQIIMAKPAGGPKRDQPAGMDED